jgi:hypothetical protein
MASSQLPTPDVSPEERMLDDHEDDISSTKSSSQGQDFTLFSNPEPASRRSPLFASPPRIVGRSRSVASSPATGVVTPRDDTPAWASLHYPKNTSTSPFPGPNQNITLRPSIWAMAASNVDEYNRIKKASNQTYNSGAAPALNALADIADIALRRPSMSGEILGRSTRKVLKARKPKPVAKIASPKMSSSPSNQAAAREARTRKKKRQHENDEISDSPPRRLRAEPVHKYKPENYTECVDYCPPTHLDPKVEQMLKSHLTSLGGDVKRPADGADDEIAHLLHPLEHVLARHLRLTSNKYLINKRLILRAKVQSIIKGTAFSKTHAQQNAIIDVNKASKIWEFFHHAGWFEDALFKDAVGRERARESAERAERRAGV